MLTIIGQYKRKILKYLFVPVFIAVLVNAGWIFHLDNKLPQIIPQCADKFNWIIEGLSKEPSNSPISDIFIGVITVFFAFFAFIQLAYSAEYIPANINYNYILTSKKTIKFLSVQLSICISLGIFNCYSDIPYICIITSVIYTIWSLLYSIIYFYWLSKLISIEEMTKHILKYMDMEEIDELERQFEGPYRTVSAYMQENDIFKFKQNADLFAFAFPYVTIATQKKGIVENIKLDEINKILAGVLGDKFHTNIKVLILFVNVGDVLSYNGTSRTETPLLAVIFNKKENYESFLQENHNFVESKIEEQFVLNGNIKALNDFAVIIGDIFEFADYKDGNNEKVYSLVTENLMEMIDSQRRAANTVWVLKREIYKVILDSYRRSADKNLTISNYEGAIQIIYKIRDVAANAKDKVLYDICFQSFDQLFRKRFDYTDKLYDNEIGQAVLRLSEIIFPVSLVDRNGRFVPQFEQNLDFYKKIIRNGINSSVLFIIYIMNNRFRFPEEIIYRYLQNNLQSLINFLLLPRLHNGLNRETYREISDYLSENILILSMILFRNFIENVEYPSKKILKMIFEVALNESMLIEEEQVHVEINRTWEEIITNRFYKYGINGIEEFSLYQLAEELEFRAIHNSGSYITRSATLDNFWILLSLYSVKYFNGGFIPSNCNNEENDNNKKNIKIQLIRDLLKRIAEYDKENISKILDIPVNEVNYLLEQYKDHLFKIIQ